MKLRKAKGAKKSRGDRKSVVQPCSRLMPLSRRGSCVASAMGFGRPCSMCMLHTAAR